MLPTAVPPIHLVINSRNPICARSTRSFHSLVLKNHLFPALIAHTCCFCGQQLHCGLRISTSRTCRFPQVLQVWTELVLFSIAIYWLNNCVNKQPSALVAQSLEEKLRRCCWREIWILQVWWDRVSLEVVVLICNSMGAWWSFDSNFLFFSKRDKLERSCTWKPSLFNTVMHREASTASIRLQVQKQ